jgi:LCP family protein required for cell wall assembly
VSAFKRRRDPDPDRPGTIYRSRPKFGRARKLGEGPPYLGEQPYPRPAGAQVPQGAGSYPGSALPPAAVDEIYARHGGAGPVSEDGNQYDSARDPRAREGQPPQQPSPGIGAPARRRRPPIKLIVGLLVLVLVAYPILLGLTAWTHLNRVDALAPAHAAIDTPDSPGRTFLVVGSDSRSALSAAERKRLGTGSAAGQRTDTIMLLHVPSGGGPTALISLPRDSYVPIPGHGRNKINAAYAFGGPSLLIETVESVTGIRIDDYVETGLGGFATVVDALGGVTLCPKFAMNDRDAHINLKKGCQQMDGKTALGYARARHSDPRGDLGRVERQRETLAAISKKTLSPGTLLQPWRAFPAATAGGGALTVDKGTSMIGLTKFVLAMRAVSGGGGVSLTVPISNPNLSTPAGSSVAWDRTQALRLFAAIRSNDMTTVQAIAAAQKKANS